MSLQEANNVNWEDELMTKTKEKASLIPTNPELGSHT